MVQHLPTGDDSLLYALCLCLRHLCCVFYDSSRLSSSEHSTTVAEVSFHDNQQQQQTTGEKKTIRQKKTKKAKFNVFLISHSVHLVCAVAITAYFPFFNILLCQIRSSEVRTSFAGLVKVYSPQYRKSIIHLAHNLFGIR